MNLPKLIFRLLLGRRLPITEGSLEVAGLNGDVVIRRDKYGIPYIEAGQDEDAWFGVGFCQGQDRSFQLEGLKRVVHGTLSESVGADVLPIDRLCRRIGFLHSARLQMETMDPETRTILEAFACGINEGRKVGCRKHAHEFALLRGEPSQYEAVDIFGVLKLMSFAMASNWDMELTRLKIVSEDGYEALKALDPTYPDWHPVSVPPEAKAGRAVDRLAEDLAIFQETVGHGGGSNNWSIAPSRTAQESAILANDPHLVPTLPPHWYLSHVRTPEWQAAGASLVGAPGFAAGHNETSAWGATAGLLDNTDLFIEEIGPDGVSVREGDEFVPCRVREEVINVKGGAKVVEKVLETSRGPIIGPGLEGEVGAISMRAVWLDPRPVKGVLEIHRCKTFDQFRRTFEQWPTLPLNMVYADNSGSIGFQLVGETPRRRKGWGSIPLAGWDPEAGWHEDVVPFDAMPYLADPENGFVATANNQPTPSNEDVPYLGMDWLDGYRQAGIVAAIEGRTDWDIAGTQALQMDQKSIPWQEMKDIVLAVPVDTDEALTATNLLEIWDGVVSSQSPAAAVYELLVAEMTQRLVKSKAPRAAEWALGKSFTPIAPFTMLTLRRLGHLVRLLREQPEGWFARSWPEEIADALAVVIRTLRGQFGSDPDKWAWGLIRPLTLRHPVGEIALFSRIFNLGPMPWGGDASTVAQASANPADPTANPLVVASMRMVLDTGDWDHNRFALPGGQSGNPLSPHYDDLLPFWERGEGVTISWSSAEVERCTRSTLRLSPR